MEGTAHCGAPGRLIGDDMPHPHRRHRPLLAGFSLAACAAVGAALLSAPATSAAAAGTQSPARFSARAIAARQLPLLQVANKIIQLTGQGDKPGYTGYGDVTISIPRRLVTLYWLGPVPSAMRLHLAQLRTIASIQVRAAPYTWQQLETQTHQIAARAGALRADGYTLSSIGPDASATGLRAGVDFARSRALAGHGGSAGNASTPAAEAGSAQAAIRRIVPGPAPVTVSNAPLSHATYRNADSSPWWGGSRIIRAGQVICSTGFAVYRGSTLGMLTAGHCGGVHTSWQTGDRYGSGTVMGTETARQPCCDTAVIQVGANEGYIYDRAWNSNVGEIVEADPWAAVVGASVCSEGATSGVRCNIGITSTGQVISFNNGGSTVTSENETGGTEESSGQEAAAAGDSGGPMIINSSSPGTVYATGTITSGADRVSCTNIDPTAAAAGAPC
jgi:hypothetical protein